MIVVCGEALIDLVPATMGDEPGFVPRGGGSPYNVSIGLARLDVPTAFLGRMSRDRFGRLLRTRLETNGVDLRFASEGPEPTTVAVVHLAAGEEPEFVFYGTGTADALLSAADLPAELPASVEALHFGSISLLREPGATTYESLMEREQGRRVLCLDPNVRPGLIPDRAAYVHRLEHWVSLMDLVKVSRADLSWLYPDLAPVAVARRWLALGPGFVAVTQGEDGAVGVSADDVEAVPGIAVHVSDTVGAGDAFTSGLLARLREQGLLDRAALRRLPAAAIADALAFANRVAASACTRSGAEPPTRAALDAQPAR